MSQSSELSVSAVKARVRFAPSPTGFLHVGSARTFIFNWLYAQRNGGTMILRLDDTDVERNSEASVTSIFDGLKWLDLGWDEEYRQSDRGALHRQTAETILGKGLAYRDFTPAHTGDTERSGTQGTWLFNPGMRELSPEESDRRAAAGEPFALRFRVPREGGQLVRFIDAVYGEQVKSAADIEDFALLRSDGMPTYHLASCADDADLRISHIIRGQDHLSNTFKHVLIFEAAGFAPPQFAHLPLLVAPDGTKLSKRRHGPVVSVTTYRDAGFLPEAFINFLCLLGWSPKNDREQMTRQELIEAFSLEGINRANAVVNFKEESVERALLPAAAPEDTFDPKALWLNAEHIRSAPVEDLSARLLPIVHAAGFQVEPVKMLQITPLIRERIKLLREVLTAADFFFVDQLPPYDPAELIPQKGDAPMALKVLKHAQEVLATTEFKHDPLDQALRAAAQELGIKAGQMFQPIRVAVCGRKNAPPLFETLEVLDRQTTLRRITQAVEKLELIVSPERSVVPTAISTHRTSARQIDLWRQSPTEHERLEFKEAKVQFDNRKLYEYCIAIANEGGGVLLLGIADKPPRQVVGTQAFRNSVAMSEKLFTAIGFRVDIEEVHHPEGRVLVFHVPSRPRGTAYHLDGAYLMRSGESTVGMSEDQLRKIFAEGEPDWLEEHSVRNLDAQDIVELLDTQTFFELLKMPYPTQRAGVIERLLQERLIDEVGGLYSIRRIGGLLLAKQLDAFPDLKRKAPRVVVYTGASKLNTRLDQMGTKGYAVGFQGLVRFVMAQLPQNEVIEDALRREVKLIPEVAVRELVANALIHQDLSIGGTSAMIEIYSNRVEISNPGQPIVPVERFIDGYQSRNEHLADLMRRMGICEEKSSGIDRVVSTAEFYQLPAPDFRVLQDRTVITISGPRDFEFMDREERIRACYQHCALKWVMSERMTNQTLRERFHLPENKSASVSQVITATIEAHLVKLDEKIGSSRKYARYLPFWA